MSWVAFLSRRFAVSSKMGGTRLVKGLAILGVALGVATLFITQAVLGGMEQLFHKTILGFNAHLVVLHRGGISDPELLNQQLHQIFPEQLGPGTPFLYREGLLVSHGRVKGAVLKGVDWKSFSQVYTVKLSRFTESDAPPSMEELLTAHSGLPLVVGKDLARDLGLGPEKNRLKVFLPRESREADKIGQKDFQEFQVTGIFETGMREFDQAYAFVDLATLRRLESPRSDPLEVAITGLEYRLRDPEQGEVLAKQISAALGLSYEVIPWQKLNGPLFTALRYERALFFVVISMVVAVAAFNIVGVLWLMVMGKSREISILRVLGAPYGSIKSLFRRQGMKIAFWGCVLGLSFGGALGVFLQHTTFFKLPKEVYLVEELPVELSWAVAGSVVLGSLCIAYLAVRFAVWRLSRNPLDL